MKVMATNDTHIAGTHMTDGNDAGNDAGTRKTIRRSAIGLALVAASVYFGFMALRLL